MGGATSALLTVSSQSYGALAYHEVGIALQRAVLVFVLLLDLPLVCVFLNAERLLAACGNHLRLHVSLVTTPWCACLDCSSPRWPTACSKRSHRLGGLILFSRETWQ